MTFLETLAPSITVGYIVPSILMCLPLSSSVLHQWLGGFWQGFPVWVTLMQYTFCFWRRKLSREPRQSDSSPTDPLASSGGRIEEMHILHHTPCDFHHSCYPKTLPVIVLTCRNRHTELSRCLSSPYVLLLRKHKSMAIVIQNSFNTISMSDQLPRSPGR